MFIKPSYIPLFLSTFIRYGGIQLLFITILVTELSIFGGFKSWLHIVIFPVFL